MNWSQGQTECREEIILSEDNSKSNCGCVLMITCKTYLFWAERAAYFQNLRLLTIPKRAVGVFLWGSCLVGCFLLVGFIVCLFSLKIVLYYLWKHGVSTHGEKQIILKFLAPGNRSVTKLLLCAIIAASSPFAGCVLMLRCQCVTAGTAWSPHPSSCPRSSHWQLFFIYSGYSSYSHHKRKSKSFTRAIIIILPWRSLKS